jgi:hypothetical protein
VVLEVGAVIIAMLVSILPQIGLAPTLESPDAELVAQVVAGNAATLQLIESYYSSVVYSSSAQDRTATPVAEYWRTKDFSRIRAKMTPTSTVDIHSSGGRSQQILTSTGQSLIPGDIHVTVDESRRFRLETDAWQLSLLDLPAMITAKPPLVVYNLTELAAKGTVMEAGWTRLDGNKVARLAIDLKDERRNYVVWVDPKKNWLIARVIQTLKGADGNESFRIEHQVEDWLEIKPSILVPTATSFSIRYKGKTVRQQYVRFEGVRVNDPLPPVPPMPKLPRGSFTADFNEGIVYQVDGQGRRTNRVYKIGAESSGFADAVRRPVEDSSYTIWGWALGIGSLSTAAVALILLLLRRRAS